MSKILTAERVSDDGSDNFVFQRSILVYHDVARRIFGNVLEIGTGTGYGLEVIAPHAKHFVSIDKKMPRIGVKKAENTELMEAKVPPIPFDDASFDCVVSFQCIEHIKDDKSFVREVRRVLRPGGMFFVSTPNILMSLTRNPWHVREYTAKELRELLERDFSSVESLGVFGNETVMDYYEKNRLGVKRITRFDVLDLQHRLPRQLLQIPYDILNRLNRKKLLKENTSLTCSIKMDDYRIASVGKDCFDLFCIARV